MLDPGRELSNDPLELYSLLTYLDTERSSIHRISFSVPAISGSLYIRLQTQRSDQYPFASKLITL